ncbi:hypothetical protein OAP18_03885, partial [Gammaproteobacteria bacterium]|nr:hypothetical protein [Gammaproteobacteria bacterium]
LTSSHEPEAQFVKKEAITTEAAITQEVAVIEETLTVAHETSTTNIVPEKMAEPAESESHVDVQVSADPEEIKQKIQQQEPELNVKVTLEQAAPEQWVAIFYGLGLSGITKNIAANCVLKSATNEKIELLLQESQMAFYNEEQKRRIQEALNDYFVTPVVLEIEVGEGAHETPAAFRTRKDAERLQEALETFENDINVKEIVERFGATIQLESIEPLTPKQY